jgi:hypothetical protein
LIEWQLAKSFAKGWQPKKRPLRESSSADRYPIVGQWLSPGLTGLSPDDHPPDILVNTDPLGINRF